MLLAASLVLVLALAGILVASRWRAPLRSDEVAAFLERSAASGKYKLSDVKITVTRLGDADLRVSVAATARTTGPLYSRVDAADYLQGLVSIYPETTLEARRLMADKDASRKPELARLRPFPADPYLATIVQMTAQAGASFPFQATVAAHREGDKWILTLISSGYIGANPSGEPLTAFGGPLFVAGEARDDARLRALAADLQSFADRVSEMRRNLAAAHAAGVSARREAFLARIAPGSIFRGAAIRSGEEQGTALYLEITGQSPGNGVTALLRNAGGWHYGRPFQGSWSADEEFESPTLSLSSPPGQAIRNAGPFLEYTQAWALALKMDSKGNLSDENGAYQYRFEFVNAGQVQSLKAALKEEFGLASSATAPGSLYRGTAVSRASGASEPVFLRFAERSEDGEALEAGLESNAGVLKRPLHGSIIGNARRSGGEPIRLRSARTEAVEAAPAASVLGYRENLEIRLRAENGSLAGEDDGFTYRFSALSAADLSELARDRAERARRFGAALRDGIAYDGTIRDDQGSVAEARLEIYGIDRQRGAIAAGIRSLSQLNVYQDFKGTLGPSENTITLVATGQGEFDYSDTLAVPFLVAPVPHTLQLALVGDSIAGAIEGDPHWKIDFPVGSFLAARTEGAAADSPAASGGVYPEFPKHGGAYLLSAGAWRPLPRNNGHVVVEKIHPMTQEEASGGALGFISQGVRSLAQKGVKIAYLEFDGKDPRPECGGDAVTLLYVGPALAGMPPVEVAPVETLKDGRRGLEIIAGAPNRIQFGEQRQAAFVREAGPAAVLLTATSALAPGAYAFNADAGYEFAVR